MNRRKRSSSVRVRDCRNCLPLSRSQRKKLADELNQQWREVCLHATIERNPEKLLWLAAAISKRKRRAPSLTTGQPDLPNI